MTRRGEQSRRRRGFTLVELIATIAVIGVLGSLTAGLMFHVTDGYLQAATTSQLHTDASAAMDRIVRELRNIPRDHLSEDTAPSIDSIAADAVVYNSTSGIRLAGSEVILTHENIDSVLISDVTGFTLQPLDSDHQPLSVPRTGTDCDPIRRVRIELTIERHGISHQLRTLVFIRSTSRIPGVSP